MCVDDGWGVQKACWVAVVVWCLVLLRGGARVSRASVLFCFERAGFERRRAASRGAAERRLFLFFARRAPTAVDCTKRALGKDADDDETRPQARRLVLASSSLRGERRHSSLREERERGGRPNDARPGPLLRQPRARA